MTDVPLEEQLKDAADRIHDMRWSSDDVARLLRAAAIEIGLLRDRMNSVLATRREQAPPLRGKIGEVENRVGGAA